MLLALWFYGLADCYQRFPIGFQAFFAMISLVGMSMLPDTPRWYYAGGREEEGDAVLARLHAKSIEHPDVQAQKLEIMRAIKLEEQNENKFQYLDLLWDRSELRAGRRIRIAYLLMVFQNMMGTTFRPPLNFPTNSAFKNRCQSYGILCDCHPLEYWTFGIRVSASSRSYGNMFCFGNLAISMDY
jgi:hypothetical protein